MKQFILTFFRVVVGALGFAAVGCDEAKPDEMPSEEYGCPYADYVVKGKVSDEEGNPIKGIAVNVQDVDLDTCFTSEDGSYGFEWGDMMPSDKIVLKYTDVDRDENGGMFMPLAKEVALERKEEGKGWYRGLFAAFGVDVNMELEPLCEYGVPHATFEVKGKVTDSEGNPLNGIEVYADGMYDPAKAYTDEDGEFALVQDGWFPSDQVELCFDDVDGEDNGGDFGKQKKVIPLVHVEEGEGWDEGKYEAEDVTVRL